MKTSTIAKTFRKQMFSFCTFCLAVVTIEPSAAVGQTTRTSIGADAYVLSQQRALQPLQAEFDRITTSKKDDPAVKAFLSRLTAIDEATRATNNALAGNRGQALNDILRTTPGRAATKAPLLAPSDLLGKFSRQFDQPLPQSTLTQAENDHLRNYYIAKLKAVTERLNAQAATIAAVDPANKDTIEGLLLVPLWLGIRDEEWSLDSIELLPERLRAADALATCERAALAAKRPICAFFMASYLEHRTAQEADAVALVAYMRKAGAALTRNKRYDEALACLEAGARMAPKGDAATSDELRFEYAQLLSDVNRPVDAATALNPILDTKPASKSFGRASVLRLKYLYQANDFKSVLADYRALYEHPDAKEFQPQILYVAWCVARQSQPDMESRLRKEFLDNFPTNSLGADLYFSTAMQALAASDYADARRILEYLEYRYPNSPLLPKVRDIQAKLAANKAGTAK